MLLQPFLHIFRYALQPVAPFTWFGLGVTSLDVVAALRLCIVLRQIKDNLRLEHAVRRAKGEKLNEPEDRSFSRDALTTLTVVYGGEALAAPYLGVPPSFMISGVTPALYAAVQALVEYIPNIPSMSIHTELPLSIVDGFSRALLLCDLIPPAVTQNASPAIADSPWTLLLTSLIVANGGFFITNLFSFLHPTPLSMTTPAELGPYGWTTTDLWCAPLITGLYALLTHAQPFWADAHSVISGMLGASEKGLQPEALDAESARAVCALVLAGLFLTRTAKNFGYQWKSSVGEKIKIQ